MSNSDKLEKVLFKYHSNVLQDFVSETMWAKTVDPKRRIYKLDSIPFYGPQIATDDEFFAEYDEEEKFLIFKETFKQSGNSIVLVIVVKDGFNKEILREQFRKLNCKSEGLNDSYFSMEVLKDVNYSIVQKRLESLEKDGIIEYAEPCLSEKHKRDLFK